MRFSEHWGLPYSQSKIDRLKGRTLEEVTMNLLAHPLMLLAILKEVVADVALCTYDFNPREVLFLWSINFMRGSSKQYWARK